MVKRLLLLTIILLLSQITVGFSQITIGTIDQGPYTPGSSIAATFSLGPDCIKPGNKFNLFLVAPNGNETEIGYYDSFYSTFVNGTIPPGTDPGTGYILRVKSTDPVLVSDDSNPFEISIGNSVSAKLNSSSINEANPETFGFCSYKATNNTLYITNESTANGAVTASITNELIGGTPTQLVFDIETKNFIPDAAHYTMFAKVKMPDGRTATKAYFIINNKTNTAFSTGGPGVVCLPDGTLRYGTFTETENGVQLNFPGNIYKIIWGDGTSNDYTLCDLKKGYVEHKYETSSCGSHYSDGTTTYYNVFPINISAKSPFCPTVGTPLSTYAKVLDVTENLFSGPKNGCTNASYIFYNQSKAGQTPSVSETECEDKNIKYNWFINGIIFKANQPKSYNLQFPPSPSGVYEIKLESVSSGDCQSPAYIQTICIQSPPEPDFDFNGVITPQCAPYTIKINDKSIVDANCNTNNSYNWIITKSGALANTSEVTFENGITEPEFTFHKQGTYEVTLQINTATCGPVSTTPPQKIIIIDSAPNTILAPTAVYCGLGEFTYNQQPGLTNVQYSGTEVDAPDTYTWTVTAADDSPVNSAHYSFENGNVTKYPTLRFNEYGTYKVTVIHKNSCGSFTTHQLVTFIESPTPSIVANPICYNDQASIIGTISNNNYISYTWSTPSGGGTFQNDNTLTPTYTPSEGDKTAGKATVILTVNTGLGGDCAFVSIPNTFIINPNNTGINTSQTICTGTTASRILTSSVVGSSFTWTAENTYGNATGFSPSGNGDINETITNNNPTDYAEIVYTITPKANNCDGIPFTFTVTIIPLPVVLPVADKTICHNNSSAIELISNISTRFTWTSVASSTNITGSIGGTGSTTLIDGKNIFTINETLQNNSFSPEIVTYTIKSFSADDCEGNETTVKVTVDPAVTPAYAGQDDTICDIDSYDLKGNEAKVGTGKWRVVSTHPITPTFAVDTDYETTVTGLVTGQTYIFEWAISAAGECGGTSAQVTISVTPRPIISTTVLDKTICHSNEAAITINSDIPTQFSWTSVATSGISGNTGNTNPTALSPLSDNVTINDVLLNNTYQQGEVIYTITPYSATGCAGTPITIKVKVDPAVTDADAGQATSICNTAEYRLMGNEPHVGNGLWTLVSVTSTESTTIANPVITTPTHFESDITGLEAGGVYTFRWTITGDGECALSYDEVTITVNMPTIPGTTSGALTVCQNNNSGVITLSSNTGNVLAWQISTNNGSTWQDIDGINTGLTYAYSNLINTTQFRAKVQNAGCTIEYSTPTTITVAPATTIAKVEDDQILCDETTAVLKGNAVANGETGEWTMVSGDPNAVIPPGANEEVTVTNLKPGTTYIFRWTINGNSPCGSTYDEITIRNNEPLDLNSLTSNAVVCNGQQVFIDGSKPIGGAENGQYEYIWQSQIIGGQWEVITGEAGEDLTITLSTTGIIKFRRIVNSGNCSSTSNEFAITVQPPITGNAIGTDQTICNGTTPMLIAGSLPTGGDGVFSYVWQSSLNGTTWTNIASVISADFQPQSLTETIYYRRIVSTLACNGAFQSVSNTVKITVNPNAKAEFTWGSTDTDCYPYTLPIQVITYADRNDTYTWYVNDVVLPSTGANFPGYTIENSGVSATIKLVVTSSLGCAPHEMSHTFSTNQAVPASFDVSDAEGCGPMQVNFTNTSLLIPGARFEWYSGDILFSTDVHPATVTLQPDPLGKDSTYVIKLKAITDCGIDSITKTVFVKAKPIAVFTPDKVEVCSPSKITFTNTSPGSTNTYYYDFGDGSDILERTDKLDVEHIYNVTVTTEFTVRMTAKNECDEDTKEWKILVYPQNITPVLGVRLEEIRGCAPHTVHFENNSIGASKFVFDFGDGSPKRTTFASGIVTYTYLTSGNFTITMTAYNSCSEIPVTKNVEVLPQPVADFQAENTLGCPGLVVKFKNNTLGGLNNSYVWDFGDGSPVSNEFEPNHTYTGDQEYYTVKLLATNELGCPIEVIKTQYIHTVQPPVAAFNVNPSTLISIPDYTFKFEDESTNNPTIWEWDFGDGTGTSTLKNPSYTYLDTGTYKVTLKVTNQQGCFTTTFKEVTIKGVPGYLFVPNSFIPGSPSPELRLFRAKGSGIKTWRFSIFNKWGQIIWETTLLDESRPAEAWDGNFKGQPMPQGVYYWKIDVEMINGSEWKGMTYDNTPPKRTGAIHLIR